MSYKHDFYAVGECGHKRNFIWISKSQKKLKCVVDFCHICNKPMKFIVKKYWEEVTKNE